MNNHVALGRPDHRSRIRPRVALLIGCAIGILTGLVLFMKSDRVGTLRSKASDSRSKDTHSLSPDTHSLSPPTFALDKSTLPSLAPGHPDYQPRRLLVVMSPRDLFAQEPRNDGWARIVEGGLLLGVQRDVSRIPGISDLQIECHTTACRIGWKSASRDSTNMALRLIRFLYMGDAMGRDANENSTIIFYKGGKFDRVSPDGYGLLAHLQMQRQQQLAAVHRRFAANKPIDRIVPHAYWPEN